jgi:hypothetical protein
VKAFTEAVTVASAEAQLDAGIADGTQKYVDFVTKGDIV